MFRRLATVCTCALALALASPAVAHADSRTMVDTHGDVWAMDTPEVGQHTRMPDRRQGDILRTVIAHNQNQIVIRTRFAQLDRVGRMSIVAAKLRTNTGMVRWIALVAGPRPNTNRWRGIVTRRDGETPLACAAHRIDYDVDVAVIRIPGTCLNNPRWVQGSVAAGTIAHNGTAFVDNPKNDGPTVQLPALTSRIRRG